VKPIAILALLWSLAAAATAGEAFDPAAFLAAKCTGCHSDEVYSRPDHRMQNRRQLEAQVRRCDANVGTRLFDDDLQALVDYLDRTYYHFPR